MDGVLKFVQGIIEAVVDLIESLIKVMIDVVDDLLKEIDTVLTKDMDIPFISTLYKFITAFLGKKEDLNVVNAVSLVLAIPFTYIYKASNHGHAPFADSTFGLDDKQFFNSTMGLKPIQMSLQRNEQILLTSDSSKIMYSNIGGVIASLGSFINNVVSLAESKNNGGAAIFSGKLNYFPIGLVVLNASMTIPLKDGNDDVWNKKLGVYFLALLKDVFTEVIPCFYTESELKNKNIDADTRNLLGVMIDLPILIINLAANYEGKLNLLYLLDIPSDLGDIVESIGAFSDPDLEEIGIIACLSGSSYGIIMGIMNAIKKEGISYYVNVGG